jgi:hypothetical protein
MKFSKLLTLAVVPVVLVACRTDEDRVDDTWTDPALTTEPAPEREVREETISLDEVAGSGVGGEAEIREVGAQAQVLARINDGGPNVTYNGGVYRGTCDMLGERVAELQSITTQADGTGQSMSTVSIPGWGTAGTAIATPPPPATPDEPTAQDPATAQPGTTQADRDRLVVAFHRGDDADVAQPVVCGEFRDNGLTSGW